MKKETDLGGVKAIAKTLLMTAVNQTPYSPMLVQHPFTSSGLVALPKDRSDNFKPIDITLNEENLKRWQDSVMETRLFVLIFNDDTSVYIIHSH